MSRLLLIETSHRRGWVALADGLKVLGVRMLEESRHHARDLAPFAHQLLTEQGWKARDLQGVIVDRGPGSYTGLRVGIMSAKTLAYAVGCPLIAIDAFAALALQSPATIVDVIADAQQDKLYVQRFRDGKSIEDLAIRPFEEWAARLEAGQTVTGPGLEIFRERIPARVVISPEETWTPQPASLLAIALPRLERGDCDDPFAVEPLYLRPSSAEENWKK